MTQAVTGSSVNTNMEAPTASSYDNSDPELPSSDTCACASTELDESLFSPIPHLGSEDYSDHERSSPWMDSNGECADTDMSGTSSSTGSSEECSDPELQSAEADLIDPDLENLYDSFLYDESSQASTEGACS